MPIFESRYNIDDKVKLDLNYKSIHDCIVTGIHFYIGKVKYTINVPIDENDYTTMENIDSCFVSDNDTEERNMLIHIENVKKALKEKEANRLSKEFIEYNKENDINMRKQLEDLMDEV